MIHTYRIALIANQWRLMRDDLLYSTYYDQAAAKKAMAHAQDVDESRAMKSKVSKALALADEMERTGSQGNAMRLREIFK